MDILVEKPQSVDRRVGGQVRLGQRNWRSSCGSWLQLADSLAAAVTDSASLDSLEEDTNDRSQDNVDNTLGWNLTLQRNGWTGKNQHSCMLNAKQDLKVSVN